MNPRRTRSLRIEIYKTINNLNPESMKNLFKVRKTNRALRGQYKLNIEIPKFNQVSFGTKSLRIQGPRIGTHYLSTLNPKKIFRYLNMQLSFGTGQNVVAIFLLILIFNSLIIYQSGLLFVCISVFCIWKKFCNIVYKQFSTKQW